MQNAVGAFERIMMEQIIHTKCCEFADFSFSKQLSPVVGSQAGMKSKRSINAAEGNKLNRLKARRIKQRIQSWS
jgi:hypothetical protein